MRFSLRQLLIVMSVVAILGGVTQFIDAETVAILLISVAWNVLIIRLLFRLADTEMSRTLPPLIAAIIAIALLFTATIFLPRLY